MFKTSSFGHKPKYPGKIHDRFEYNEIRKNPRIKDYLDQKKISESNYRQFTIDCFGKIRIRGNDYWVSVDVWGRQHKNLETYLKMYGYQGKTIKDYKRLKVYDNLRKIMFEEGIIDVHLVVALWEHQKLQINGFINKEIERILFEKHGLTLNYPLPAYNWNNLLKDIKQAKDHTSVLTP